MRDIVLADTVYVAFTTRAFATGIPTVLAGTPVVSAYEDAGLTQITAGITLGVDHDSVVGLNMLTIVATGANGFEDNKDYNLVITTGTVGGVSVIGEVVGQFSIQRSPVNWANVSNPTTALDLSGTDIQLVDTVTDVTNQVTADMTAISGDISAADNLESQYDTTGLVGDTFPATQAQVGNLATGSAAISVVSESQVLTTGTEVNDYTVTDEIDQTYHEISDAAGAMELYYQFDVSGNGVASEVVMTGRLNSANDSIGVYAYNWSGAAWDQIGTLAGTGGSTDGVSAFNLLTRHTGTGANLGKVRVRGYAASGLTSAVLYIDQAIVSYAVVAQSVGYANGAIWFNSNASNINTEVYVDGTADNPVSSEAAVNTLLASVGLTRVEVAIDSSITFTTSHISEFWTGEHWALALGGQNVSSSHFRGADVTGTGTGTTAIDFEECGIGIATLHQFHMVNCGFNGTLTLGEAGNYIISGGHSAIAGPTTPIIDTGAAIANVNLTMPDWHNGIEIQNLNNSGTDLFSISGIGQIIYAASSSGTVNQRGRWKVTNTGGVTITYDDPSQNEIDTLIDTNELQTDWTNGGRLDLILDELAIQGDTNEAAIGALNDIAAADVLTQVNAALDTAIAELGIAAPTATPTLRTGLMLMYMMARNRVDVDTTGTDAMKIYNNAGTQIASKSITDDSTDYSESQMV